jgi:hypothetical protein
VTIIKVFDFFNVLLADYRFSRRLLVMVQPWQMMLKVKLQESIEALMLELRAPRKTPKLALSLK